jgi:hypothetical protein
MRATAAFSAQRRPANDREHLSIGSRLKLAPTGAFSLEIAQVDCEMRMMKR